MAKLTPAAGPVGNQILTSATALVLTILLAAEGVTILFLDGPLARTC